MHHFSKYGKFESALVIVAVLLLVLLFADKISGAVFTALFIPVSLVMLILGILELKHTLENNGKSNPMQKK